jgi:hypothetical protein
MLSENWPVAYSLILATIASVIKRRPSPERSILRQGLEGDF